jgi:hypothetical protein
MFFGVDSNCIVFIAFLYNDSRINRYLFAFWGAHSLASCVSVCFYSWMLRGNIVRQLYSIRLLVCNLLYPAFCRIFVCNNIKNTKKLFVTPVIQLSSTIFTVASNGRCHLPFPSLCHPPEKGQLDQCREMFQYIVFFLDPSRVNRLFVTGWSFFHHAWRWHAPGSDTFSPEKVI